MSMFNEEVLERITLDILYELGYECINDGKSRLFQSNIRK